MVAHVKTEASKTIPYIQEYPLIGSVPAFMKDRLHLFVRLAERGDVCGMHFGPYTIVLFNRSEHVHRIFVELANDTDKGRIMHKAFKPVMTEGVGVFISEGELHQRQRKLMAPSFQPRQISSYADIMVDYTEKLQQGWRNGATIDINQEMTRVTMSIIGKVLFDADVFTETDELGEAFTIILGYTTHQLASLFSPPRSWPTPANRRMLNATQLLRERVRHLIAERRASNIERNDFLSILLNAHDEQGKSMSDDQLMEECLTLFAAGHETTATALAWTWYLLCQHRDVYEKVQQEVDSVLQGRAPGYADLARLPYCLQVFKEAMRLYPPAYAFSREALHDVEIDGYLLPKGYVAMVSPYTMQRRPDYFPDPEQFDPDRFTPEREKQLPRYAYIPFGAGPRICIGNHFAMMEGHLLLATLAQRATFTLVPGQSIEPDPIHHLTLRPNGRIDVMVKKR
jgi:cytochrome P450